MEIGGVPLWLWAILATVSILVGRGIRIFMDGRKTRREDQEKEQRKQAKKQAKHNQTLRKRAQKTAEEK